jgi:hypothetical protein
MTSHPLIISQFALLGHPHRTEHWNIVAVISQEEARVFELAGNYDTFTYAPKTIPFSTRMVDYRGGFLLCGIAQEELEYLQTLLGTITIVRHNPEFDCQTWVVLGVRKLQEEGLVPRDVTETMIREELEREKERWELADDTILERLAVKAGADVGLNT